MAALIKVSVIGFYPNICEYIKVGSIIENN